MKEQNPNHWTARDFPTLPDFKIHYKTAIIKLCGTGTITDILINGIALSLEINLHINGQIFGKDVKPSKWKNYFSTHGNSTTE